MKELQSTEELIEVARRVIWFDEPEETLKRPVRFLTYVMRYGTESDLIILERAGVGLPEFKEALAEAPAGIMDRRSWDYWHLKCGITNIPELPVRYLG